MMIPLPIIAWSIFILTTVVLLFAFVFKLVREIPSVSLCGKEINFISHADRLSPFTFKAKLCRDEVCTLLYGGTLQQPYDPHLLAYHSISGRIYHQITTHKHYTGKYGLLHPHLCLELAESIVHNDVTNEYVMLQGDISYPLKVLS